VARPCGIFTRLSLEDSLTKINFKRPNKKDQNTKPSQMVKSKLSRFYVQCQNKAEARA